MNRFLDWVVTEWVVRFQLELKCMSILEVPILWCEDKDPSDFFGRKRQKARSGSFSANLTRLANTSFLTSGFMNTTHLSTHGLSIGNHYDQSFQGFKFLEWGRVCFLSSSQGTQGMLQPPDNQEVVHLHTDFILYAFPWCDSAELHVL